VGLSCCILRAPRDGVLGFGCSLQASSLICCLNSDANRDRGNCRRQHGQPSVSPSVVSLSNISFSFGSTDFPAYCRQLALSGVSKCLHMDVRVKSSSQHGHFKELEATPSLCEARRAHSISRRSPDSENISRHFLFAGRRM